MSTLRIILSGFAAVLLWVTASTLGHAASSRIKDIANFQGVRSNMLVGYGLVVGLDGTGDTLRNSPFTQQSIQAMLERLGINTRDATQMKTKNVAAVMVTTELPPFGRQGSRLDVTVSTMGDSTNLLGGTLLVTPLLGADGQVYAVAQGSVAIAGFKAQGQAASITKGAPTSGRIANGAVIEKEVPYTFGNQPVLRLSLKNPDFTTAERVARVINHVRPNTAKATDPSTIDVFVPPAARNDIVGFVTKIEQLRVTPDQPAKIIIDEVSGTIVIGANVRVSTVAISQGNLTIKIGETPQVSQPAPLSQGGTTAVVPRTNINVNEGDGKKLMILPTGVSLQSLVNGLNALGVGPRDLISILEAIKAAGALQADIEVM